MIVNLSIQIIVFSIIRFSVTSKGAYLFLMFLINCCIGGGFVVAPTFSQIVFGQVVGSNIYGFFWCTYGAANFIQYAYIRGLSGLITFDNVIYICLGMSVLSIIIIVCTNFRAPWNNPVDQLGYCKECCKK